MVASYVRSSYMYGSMSHDLLLQIPGLGVSIQLVTAWTTLALSTVNLIHASYIILTSGVGKNGSTVAVREWYSLLAYTLIYKQKPWIHSTLVSLSQATPDFSPQL